MRSGHTQTESHPKEGCRLGALNPSHGPFGKIQYLDPAKGVPSVAARTFPNMFFPGHPRTNLKPEVRNGHPFKSYTLED